MRISYVIEIFNKYNEMICRSEELSYDEALTIYIAQSKTGNRAKSMRMRKTYEYDNGRRFSEVIYEHRFKKERKKCEQSTTSQNVSQLQ